MATPNSMIEFPIGEIRGDAPMKTIPLSALPNFQGIHIEDPNTFLFEFDIVCRSYDYITNAQKLKIFPATLKGAALRWFIGMEGNTIRTWHDMKQGFLKKYEDYCKSRDIKEEIFKITQKNDESLEDYVE